MNWQIDGVDNNDFWHNIPAVNQGGVSGIAGVVLPIDSIDEFSAQTQSNAEAGRNAGGTVNLVIKSGTNSLHGSAYYYNRNEFYGSHSPFFQPSSSNPKAPPLRNQNYGFSVGGPIIKGKVFYFLSFEKQNYLIGLSGVATEPSTAWQTQAGAALAKYGVTASSLSNTLLTTLWPQSVLTDPGVVGRGPVIGNFFSSSPSTGFSYNGVAKIDYNITDKHRLFLRWFWGTRQPNSADRGKSRAGHGQLELEELLRSCSDPRI
jgi:hypothetical protein